MSLFLTLAPTWPLPAQTTTARWQARLKAIDEQLAQGQWSKAERSAKWLRHEMYGSLVGGGEGLLGMLFAMQGVAAYGKGDTHRGEWTWLAALQFFPEVASLDLSRYREVGQALASLEERPAPDREDGKDEVEAVGVEPPRRKKTEMPTFPRARVLSGRTVSVKVMCVVDEQGMPRHPKIMESANEPVLAFAALEALGKWRFEPATRHGEKTAVWYAVTVNFEVP